MTAIVRDCDQRSEAWRLVRAGRLTGSCAAAILAERKRGSGELAVRRDLRFKLVVERLTGLPEEEPARLPSAMQHGVDTEAQAFRAYEAATGQLVQRVGFLEHPELMAGASPDGYVGAFTGLVELKCPKSTTHLQYLRDGVVPDEYRPQILHNLWISGAEWCDFVSFDDRFPPELRLFRRRVQRESCDLVAYELAARLFLSECEKELAQILDQVGVAA